MKQKAILFLCVIAPLMMVVFFRHQLIQVDPDEGYVIARAYLLSRGFHYHNQIWSDQPIMVPLLLEYWLSYFGFTLNAARSLVAVSSGILLIALYVFQKNIFGKNVGLYSVLVLLFSRWYLHFSSASMIGVPTLCLEMICLSLLTFHPKYKIVLYLSGFFFICAMGAKLFALEITPIILIILWQKNSSLSDFVRFLAGVIIGILVYLNITGVEQLGAMWTQLVSTQTISYDTLAIKPISQSFRLLSQEIFIWPLAIFGISYCCIKKQWQIIPTIIWIIITAISICYHRPSFSHHYLTFALPLSILVGRGIEALSQTIQQLKIQSYLRTVASLTTITIIIFSSFYWILTATRVCIPDVKKFSFAISERKLNFL